MMDSRSSQPCKNIHHTRVDGVLVRAAAMGSAGSLLSDYEIVDLSLVIPRERRPLRDEIPYSYPFSRMQITGEPPDGRGYTLHMLLISEHFGTHMDAPAHFGKLAGKVYIHQIPLDRCMGPCCVLDFAGDGLNLKVAADHIRAWERAHGEIQREQGHGGA